MIEIVGRYTFDWNDVLYTEASDHEGGWVVFKGGQRIELTLVEWIRVRNSVRGRLMAS